MNSRKAVILLVSIILSFTLFFLLSTVFKRVSKYITRNYTNQYIQPTTKDSLYTDILLDTLNREPAIDLNNELLNFYTLSDSLQTILEAEISPELIKDIIISKGMIEEIRMELSRFDNQQIIQCTPRCLEQEYTDPSVWENYFKSNDLKEINDFMNKKIVLVSNAEQKKLNQIKIKINQN